MGLAPAAAPFGGTGVLGGLGLGLGLGRVEGGGAGAAGVSEWFSVFSTNEKVNRSRLIQTHTIYVSRSETHGDSDTNMRLLGPWDPGWRPAPERAMFGVRTKAESQTRLRCLGP